MFLGLSICWFSRQPAVRRVLMCRGRKCFCLSRLHMRSSSHRNKYLKIICLCVDNQRKQINDSQQVDRRTSRPLRQKETSKEGKRMCSLFDFFQILHVHPDYLLYSVLNVLFLNIFYCLLNDGADYSDFIEPCVFSVCVMQVIWQTAYSCFLLCGNSLLKIVMNITVLCNLIIIQINQFFSYCH